MNSRAIIIGPTDVDRPSKDDDTLDPLFLRVLIIITTNEPISSGWIRVRVLVSHFAGALAPGPNCLRNC